MTEHLHKKFSAEEVKILLQKYKLINNKTEYFFHLTSNKIQFITSLFLIS